MTVAVDRRPGTGPRANLNRSELIRHLAALDVAGGVDGIDARSSFAERLGLWLGWTDAIALSAALDAGVAVRSPQARSGRRSPAHAATLEFTRVKAALAESITTDELLMAGTVPGNGDFSPYRRCHLGHQRAMAAGIAPLRATVRAAMAGLSPGLGRLAALDAAMDDALGPRERHLLASVPTLLERHFKRVHAAHPPAAADPMPPPDNWPTRFGADMQAVLLAELDIRLLPVEGMIDAIRNESAGRQ